MLSEAGSSRKGLIFLQKRQTDPCHKTLMNIPLEAVFAMQGGCWLGTFEVNGGLHVHKGQRHKFRDATRAQLQVADGDEVARPIGRAVHMAKHDGCCCAQAHLMCSLYHLQGKATVMSTANAGKDLSLDLASIAMRALLPAWQEARASFHHACLTATCKEQQASKRIADPSNCHLNRRHNEQSVPDFSEGQRCPHIAKAQLLQ